MSYSTEEEIEQMKSICEQLGYSVSDVLRDAMKKTHKLDWAVPLWRQSKDEIKPESINRREYRAAKSAENKASKKPAKKKSKK